MKSSLSCGCSCLILLIIIGASVVKSQQDEQIPDETNRRNNYPPKRVYRSDNTDQITIDDETTISPYFDEDSETTIFVTLPPKSGGGENKVDIGGYKRTYTEKRYELNRNVIEEKHTNKTFQSETKVTFHRGPQSGKSTGAKILTLRNETISYPNGQNLTEEFSNITFFNGPETDDKLDMEHHPFTVLTYEQLGYVPARPHPCEQSSCYPATGNLLLGRESMITSTSTCGLEKEERFCVVSYLDEKKKCFLCDSRRDLGNPTVYHHVSNIIHRNYPNSYQRTWWQSENGVENVTIQLNLEAEFHFTHLIITFKTFRPAAMFIERSFDFGKTWKIYRYFAYDCAESFPGIPKGPAKSIADVICETRYSTVAPSTEGEVIFRVLPRNLDVKDPYSREVQNLLKMTNLRINFTKLHTLGDDLLDRRTDIQEKYYYAIYEMVVRGSCSCYGHAARCLPLPNVEIKPEMVHGMCECTHNTKGLNCEECEDFYQDLPWKPAFGKQSNQCKKCNCNNHSRSCHFDAAVYEASGRVSGGVCDNCQHNTAGHRCEQCKQFFYLSSFREITDEDACQACDCDPRGSLDDGICDSKTDADNGLEAGKCHCKKYAAGRRCDRCVNGYWNLNESKPDGCQECTCNLHGTVGNEGCNMLTGECTCKRYVTGRDCNQCLPEFYGLSDERDGCKPCDCDVGGAYDNNCDVITGQCRCRPHVGSRNCSQPEQGYFSGYPDYLLFEAEVSRSSPNTQVIVREPFRDGRESTWTGVGFMRTLDESYLEFIVDNIETTMEYDLVIRYEPQQNVWQQVNVIVTPDRPPNPDGPCANTINENVNNVVLLRTENREANMYPPLCLEAGTIYTIKLDFKGTGGGTPSSALIDSIVLIPKMEDIKFFKEPPPNELYLKEQFEHYRCGSNFMSASKYPVPEECSKMLSSVGYFVYNGAYECGCDPTGSKSSICDPLGGQCQCKLNVVGRKCDRCAPGTYGFGPEGCRPCECNPIGSLDNFCDSQSGQCRCRPNTYGLQCDQCQPGYWNFPNCQRCNCNGHADICDSHTGTCIDCRDSTVGSTCDRCVEGYYGDPRLGVDIACRPCPCPGTIESGHSFAARCALDRLSNDVVCECEEGYSGPRCDTCADNYFGNPDSPDGKCRPCSCNNNIDISRPGNCDLKTGECLQCLFNTESFSCEQCKAGFYGDAINQMCRMCVCNLLGTDSSAGPCDRITGQCPCHPNVEGLSCDQCREDHWKIASGKGCDPCSCDPIGSTSTQCNLYDGQCDCKPGFGGIKCDQCQTNYWGDPNKECYACDCNQWGSSTMQCDRETGSCVCNKGIGGYKCDECAKGFIGNAPHCETCGECFNNWDRIIGEIKKKTTKIVEAASQIKQQGATGAYTREFDGMQKKIDEVKGLLNSSSISTLDLEELQDTIDLRKDTFTNISGELDSAGELLADVSQRILLTNVSLEEIERKVDLLQTSGASLKEKAINLQEANVEGALNLTREAKRRSDDATRRKDAVQKTIADSDRNRRRIDTLLNQIEPQINKQQDEVQEALISFETSLNAINSSFPSLNNYVCDRSGDPCDLICGGAGCNKCGGLSCEGAVTNAENALEYAENAYKELKKKGADAEDLLRIVTQTKSEVDEAKNLSLVVYASAEEAKNRSEATKIMLEDVDNQILEFLSTPGATPNDIQALAKEVLSKNITLEKLKRREREEKIKELAEGIRSKVDRLTDIEEILAATAHDLHEAKVLKERADYTEVEAKRVLEDVVQVRDELDKALDAQKSAESAIEKARDDITGADIDLKQIQSETADAKKKASESINDLDQLKKRLEDLIKKNFQNERRRGQAKNESSYAFKYANRVRENSTRLKEEYKQVSQSLESKLLLFEGAKEKESMQNQANRLANNVNDRLKELTEMENENKEHERRGEEMLAEIESLAAQMETQLRGIKKIEEYHRTCNS